MTGLLLWLAAGAVAGAAGKVVLPGPPQGWPLSLLTGVAGGALGGIIATLLDMGGVAELDMRAVVLALLSAILLVILVQLIRAWRTRVTASKG